MGKCLGVFDSGFGGLTVLKELLKDNRFDKVVYFGDTARVPYGTQSADTIVRYSLQDVRFLAEQGADEIVIACNTVSATAMEALQAEFFMPIHGVIDVAAEGAARATKNKKVGLIATPATVKNGAYERKLRELDAEIALYPVACPLLVVLVEYGFIQDGDPVTAAACEHYLKPLKDAGVDALILGCTHFPVLEHAIAAYMGEAVTLINNGVELAKKMDKTAPVQRPELHFFVSADSADFDEKRRIFLPDTMQNAAKTVDIARY